MLSNHERELLSEALKLPENTEIEYVYAATYTLSLEFLLGILLWLDNNDKDLKETTPLEVLKSLMVLAGKMRVYCHAGNIAPPKRAHSILRHLDEIVQTIHLPEDGAFHPKFILIKYSENSSSARFRLVILSRNLSFSSAWDVMFAVEATVGRSETEFGIELAEYLRAIDRSIAPDRLGELRFLDPVITGSHVSNIESVKLQWQHPGYGRDSLIVHQPAKLDACLVVSPFIDGWFIRDLAGRIVVNPNRFKSRIVSRQSELDQIDINEIEQVRDKVEFYVFVEDQELQDLAGSGQLSSPESLRDTAGNLTNDGDDDYIDAETNIRFNPLHAKIYLLQEAGKSLLALGSANATRNGWAGRNSECLAFLETKKLDAEKMWRSMFINPKNGAPYPHIRQYQPRPWSDTEDPDEQLLDEMQKRFVRLEISGKVTESHVELKLPGYSELIAGLGGFGGTLELFSLHGYESDSQPLNIVSEGAIMPYSDLAEVSSFFIGRLGRNGQNRDVVLKARLDWGVIGHEERMKAFFRNTIADKQAFFKLLKLLLSGFLETATPGEGIFDLKKPQAQGSESSISEFWDEFSFEDMVYHFSQKRANTPVIDKLIKWYEDTLGKDNDAEIDEFLGLWKKMSRVFGNRQ